MVKANSALLPLVVLGHDVFGNKHSMSGAPNQLVFLGFATGSNKRDNRVAIWRCDRHPTAAGFIALINNQSETELVHIEPQTSILIADEDVDTEEAKVRILPIQTKSVL